MPKKFRNSIAALAATGAVLAGGCSAEGSGAEFGANSPELTYAFDQVKAYWAKEGQDVGAIALKTIMDGEVRCSTNNITVIGVNPNSASPATYCAGKRTIYISNNSYAGIVEDMQAKGTGPEAVAAVTTAHELGHAVIRLLDTPVTGEQEELTADCLAGVAIAAIKPELATEAKAFMQELGSDGHGTSDQRVDAFTIGIEASQVGCDSIMPDSLTPSPLPS